MRQFSRDNEWQRGIRDRFLVPWYAQRAAHEGRYVLIDKGRCATMLQKRAAIDTICQGHKGMAVCIEEKIVRRVYDKFFLETESCTVPGCESPGWMQYAEADFLLYAFVEDNETGLRCWLIDFPALREWFWAELKAAPDQWRLYTMSDTYNHTAGRLVPVEEVSRNVPSWFWTIRDVNGTLIFEGLRRAATIAPSHREEEQGGLHGPVLQ